MLSMYLKNRQLLLEVGPELDRAVSYDGEMDYLRLDRRQAAAMAKRLIDKKVWLYYLAGFDHGDLLLEMFKQGEPYSHFIVAEHDRRMLRTAMENQDFIEIMKSGRVFVLRESARLVTIKTLERLGDLPNRRLKVIPPRSQRDSAWQMEMAKVFQECNDTLRTGLITGVSNSCITGQNLLDNLPVYLATPSIHFIEKRFESYPAVCVSAGPSVDKHIPMLKDARYRDKYVLIAVSTMLTPLLKQGIRPDFVCALDFHEMCGQFFDNLQPAGMEGICAVLESKVTGPAVAKWRKLSPLCFLTGNDWMGGLLREAAPLKAHCGSGSTVGHMVVRLAQYLGCSQTLMIGQDLCFTDNRYYPDCVFEAHPWKENLRHRAAQTDRRVKAVDSRTWWDKLLRRPAPVEWATDEEMHSYIMAFEHIFEESKLPIYDCTEGGAVKEKAITMPFRKALKQFAAKPIDPIRFNYRTELEWSNYESYPAAVKQLETRREELKKIVELLKEIIGVYDEAEGRWDEPEHLALLKPRIAAAKAQLEPLTITTRIADTWAGTIEMMRGRQDGQMKQLKLAGMALTHRQVENDRTVMAERIYSCQEMDQALVKVIAELNKFIP